MTKRDIKSSEFNSYYQVYIDKAGDGNVFEELSKNLNTIIHFFESINVEKLHYRYAEDKWTIKEILQHIIDTERVFAYRALRASRNDRTDLPGFDQDAFVVHSHANQKSIVNLLSEYKSVRMATLSLFESFDDRNLAETGIINGSSLSVRAIGFIIVGHENHHLEIIHKRYL